MSSFYASNIAQTLGGLTLSSQMSQTSGGTETSTSVTMPGSGTNLYVELAAQGGAQTGTPALPNPTGKGWSIALSGNTILAGNWSAVFSLAKSGTSMSGASLFVRCYRRTLDGTYYPIASMTLSGQSFGTRATYTLTPVSVFDPWQFVAGDTLYVDAFVYNGSTAWASDVFTVYVSNSASLGVTNDGMVTSPQLISTPAGLSCLIGSSAFQTGTTLPVLNQSFTLADALDQRSILTLIGEDMTGTLAYQRGMPVIFSDYAQGKLYDGYVNSDKLSRPSAGSSAQLEHALTFMDHHYDADKRANVTNYLNWPAGDMVCDFVQSTLTQEGVVGDFALESDYTPATFGQGTLAGTVATTTTTPFTYAPNTSSPPITSNTGDLELTRAGTPFSLTEQTTSDFSSGTLTNMTAANNQLSPTTQSAVKVVAFCPVVTGQNVPASASGGSQSSGEYVLNSAYIEIWSGSMTVGTNDTLNYDLWIASTSPAFLAGVDLTFSDGSTLSSHNGTLDSNNTVGLFDQNTVSVDVLSDLTNYAKDTWYTRNITLMGLNGKTINSVSVFITGSVVGTYTVFVKNCYLSSHSSSPFLGTTATATQVNPPVVTATGSYFAAAVTTSVVPVFNPLVSVRTSPAHSISSVGLVQSSTISWTASLPTSGASTVTYPPGVSTVSTQGTGTGTALVMLASYDGTTWLPCQNNQALPGLPSGANVSGLSLYLQEQFSAGSDPSAIPALLQVRLTINSAAVTSVSDIVATYGSTAAWNTGTSVLTTPNANGDLTLGSSNPLTRTWSGGITNQTFFPGTGSVQATQGTSGGAYFMTPYSWCQSRFDFAGSMQDGTIEADIKLSDVSHEAGIEYRQTGWGNGSDIAYYVSIGQSNILELALGNNTSGNIASFTVVAQATISISSGTFYHLKIVIQDNRHTIYFNHNSTPAIDVLDNTYTGAGQIGFRGFSSNSTITISINNFSLVTTNISGTWTSPATTLSALGTCGYSQICWTDTDSTGKLESTTTVLASIDGGTTWQECTNGAEIPQLPRGTSLSGASLVLQLILSSATPPISTPIIMGLYARVCGNYGTVSGTRVSPALSLSPVGYVASSNVMWNANVPTNTSVVVATSQDGANWTNVPNSGAGASLSYWTPQPVATQDLFASNSSANYTNTSKSGGSAASATYDTANSRLILSGGSGGLYLNNSISCADVDLLCDLDESDAGGLVFCEVDTSDYYELGVYDASSSGGFTNQLRLYKVASGTRSLLGNASTITFTRGTFHRVRVKRMGALLAVYFDGNCVQAYLDSSPLGAGACGLRNDGGTSRYYQLWIQPLGTNLSGQVLYTKVTMTTSDPSVMPQLFTLVASVRGATIGTGATIAQLHPITTPFAAYYSNELDTTVRTSGDYFWYIDRWRKLHFGERLARPGAFPVQSVYDPAQSSGYLLYQPQVSVQASADLYRGQQIITNVNSLVTPPPEIKVADGSSTSWTMGYPLYSAPTITINGQATTVGVQGIDTGRQFYWQPGSASISYDSSLPKIPAGSILSFTYVGQSTVNVVLNNTASQSAQASLEGNSGIVAEIESAQTGSVNGMTVAQATTFGQGLLGRFGANNTIELIGVTQYPGLAPGTVIGVFLPEMLQTWNAQLPIVKVTTTGFMSTNGMLYFYAVDATNGPSLNNYTRVWQ